MKCIYYTLIYKFRVVCVLELDDPASKLSDIVKEEFNISEELELTSMMENIRNSFKKFGPSSGKKIKKYVPQRLKEVSTMFIVLF